MDSYETKTYTAQIAITDLDPCAGGVAGLAGVPTAATVATTGLGGGNGGIGSPLLGATTFGADDTPPIA